MKFSAFLIGQGLGADASPTNKFNEMINEAKLADELGFDGVWLAEHHFTNYGFCSAPLQLAVKIASETERIRIGTAVLVLPLYNPVRLAEDIGMADVLTGGRLNLGIGRGYQKEEFDKMGIPIQESRERFEEIVDILELAWSQKDFTYEGKYYQVDTPLTVWPQPVQEPHPEIVVAASTENSLQWAAEKGYAAFNSGYFVKDDLVGQARDMYVEALKKAGKSTENPEFKSLRFMHLTEDGSIGPEVIEASRLPSRVSAAFREGTHKVLNGRIGDLPPAADEVSDEEWAERLILGSPETVRAKVEELQAAGVTELCCWFSFGTLSTQKARRSMELFAEGVIKPLREGSA